MCFVFVRIMHLAIAVHTYSLRLVQQYGEDCSLEHVSLFKEPLQLSCHCGDLRVSVHRMLMFNIKSDLHNSVVSVKFLKWPRCTEVLFSIGLHRCFS